jgi:oligosaccharide repeat unit polymerase
MLLLLAPLAVLYREGFWLHPLVFVGLWGVSFSALPEASMIISGLETHAALPDLSAQAVTDILDYKYVLDCVALLSTYLGFYLARGIPALRVRHGAPRLVSVKLLIMIIVSIGAFAVLVQAAGGVEALALQRGVRREERVLATIGGGHWHFLTAMAGPVVLMAAALMRRPLRSPAFLAALFFALSSKFIVTGSRGGTLTIVVLLFFILAARKGRIPTGRTIAFVLIILVVIGLMTQFRGRSSRMESVEEFKVEGQAHDLVVTAITVFGKYSAVSNDFAIYARVPESEPLLLGKSYLAVFAVPVPRALWESKPPGVGRMATETFIPQLAHLTGVPASGVGEAFWNFHIPGVVVVFVLWGVFLRFIWKSVAAMRAPGFVVLYVMTIYYLAPYTDAIYKWLHYLVPAVGALLFFCLEPIRALIRGGRQSRSLSRWESLCMRGRKGAH